jgi:hypothetical protein
VETVWQYLNNAHAETFWQYLNDAHVETWQHLNNVHTWEISHEESPGYKFHVSMFSYWLYLSLRIAILVMLCCTYTKTYLRLSNAPWRQVATVEDNRTSEKVLCLTLNPKIQHLTSDISIKWKFFQHISVRSNSIPAVPYSCIYNVFFFEIFAWNITITFSFRCPLDMFLTTQSLPLFHPNNITWASQIVTTIVYVILLLGLSEAAYFSQSVASASGERSPGKVWMLYILILVVLGRRWEDIRC